MLSPSIQSAKEADSPARRAHRALASLLLVAVGGFANAVAAESTLTLEQAQRLAVQRSRQLAGMASSAVAARDLAVAAGQLPDPVVTVGIDNMPVSGADRFSLSNDFMTMRRIGVMQELTRSDKRQWRAEGYALTADKAQAQKMATLAAIERDTAIAWLERYYAEQIAVLVAGQVEQAKLEILAAEGAYRAGQGSQGDLVAARSALAMAGDRVHEAESRVQTARTMLARWTGEAADIALAGLPATDAIVLEPSRLEAQLANHPQVEVLARQENIARAEVKLAEAGKQSDWSVELALQQRGSAYSNMVSVSLSAPLQWDRKNRQDRELSAKLAMADQATAEREEAQRMVVAEVRAMTAEWDSGRQRIARYERELLPLASDRTQSVLSTYRGGKATLSEVLAARRGELDVRLQALQLQLDTARLWARLNFLFPRTSPMARPAAVPTKDTP